MKKNYILDTNVLLHDPNSLLSFQDNNVILPMAVIEEIDRFKRDVSELGRNAREVSRLLDGFRRQGRLCEGVRLPEGGRLRIDFEPSGSNGGNPPGNGGADSRILSVALRIMKDEAPLPAVVVSKDINLRLKADAMGLRAEDYETDRVGLSDLYSGIFTRDLPSERIDAFRRDGSLPLDGEVGVPNEYALLRDESNPRNSVLARVAPEGDRFLPLEDFRDGVWGVRPRNKEQFFALDALMRDEIRLVTIMGKAGTGKTLLAVAAGLMQVMETRGYHRLLVSRPTFPMGRDIGYLPGDIEEKLHPWMQPIYDCLDLLIEMHRPKGRGWKSHRDVLVSDAIGIEPLTYIRGRSIPNQFIVVDEAQNLTPLEVKTVLTRVGHNAKIVLTGDPSQIDNPYVDSASNGFNATVNRFRNERLAAHIELRKGERSELAELAANLL